MPIQNKNPKSPTIWLAILIIIWLFAPFAYGQDVSQLKVNEFLASNGSGIADEAGELEDWIEIYNPTAVDINIGGLYVSDDPLEINLYQIPTTAPDSTTVPAGGYLRLWADKDLLQGIQHVNLKLGSGGESVILTQSDGVTIIDQVDFGPQVEDISYGRYPDGSSNLQMFDVVTPEAANDNTILTVNDPTFSVPGGLYNASVALSLAAENTNEIIYYTLDGSEPDPANVGGVSYPVKKEYPGEITTRTKETFIYNGNITVSSRNGEPNEISEISPSTVWWNAPLTEVFKGNVVRAKVYNAAGTKASNTITQTYLIDSAIDSRYSLPVVSITMDPADLFDYNEGIYIPGVNYDTTGTTYNAELRGKDSEMPAHIEFFEEDGSLGFSQNIGVRTHGGASRKWGRKSLKLYARSDYDEQDYFEYDMFPDLKKKSDTTQDLEVFKRLLMRNSGNYWAWNLFKDAAMQEMVNDKQFETQHQRPVVHFINGIYFGVMNMRQRIDDHMIATHYDLDNDDVVIIENTNAVDEGEPEDLDYYLDMVDYIEDNNMADQDKYDNAALLMDMDNFINYNATHIYINNTDWLTGNRKVWRKRTDNIELDAAYGHDGKFRWFLYDTDYGFETPNENRLAFTLNENSRYTKLINNLRQNTGFKNRFINAFADLMNTSFKPAFAIETINRLQAEIDPEVPEHSDRWRQLQQGHNGNQRGNANEMRAYANDRPALMKQHLINYFGLSGTMGLTLDVTGEGNIKINQNLVNENTKGVDGNVYPWEGDYFKGVPVILEAFAKGGSRFVRWEGDVSGTNPKMEVTFYNSSNIRAVFEDISDQPTNNVFINEYLADNATGRTDNNGDYEDWIEIYNANDFPIDLAGKYITDDLEEPTLWQIPTGQTETVVPAKGFLLLYADKDDEDGPTHVGIKLGSGGEAIGLYEELNGEIRVIDSLTFGPQETDVAEGRYPDGSANVVAFTENTPKRSNVRPEKEVMYRLNAGGFEVKIPGPDWDEDSKESPAFLSTTSANKTSGYDYNFIQNATSAPNYVFGRYRYGASWLPQMQYALPLPSGNYEVSLYFAEPRSGGAAPGQRKFGVNIETERVLNQYDIRANVGDGTDEKIFTVEVRDGFLNIDFVVQVGNPIINALQVVRCDTPTENTAPVLASISSQSNVSGSSANLQLSATDAENDQLTFSASGLPAGLSISSSGLISGTISAGAGTYNATVSVTDGTLNATRTFAWTITEAPVNGSPLYRVNAGGFEVGDDNLNWSEDSKGNPVSNLGSTVLDKTSGYAANFSAFNTTDAPDEIFGRYRYGVSYSDDLNYSFPVANGVYELNLYFAEQRPYSAVAGERVFDISIEGDIKTVDYDIAAAVGANTDKKTYVINVTDGSLDFELIRNIGNPIINGIEVIGTSEMQNTAPVLANVANQNHAKGDIVSLQLSASDDQNDLLTWSQTGLPEGLELNQDGSITGTADTIGVFNITLEVSDGDLSDSQTFTWTVRGDIGQNTPLYSINAGGFQVNATEVWEADHSSTPSPYLDSSADGKTTGWNTSNANNNSDAPAIIFGTNRYSPTWEDNIKYHFPVSNGSYIVKLYFAEKPGSTTQAGDRTFDILLEGDVVESALDIVSEVGSGTIQRDFNLTVTDGVIDLDLVENAGEPLISGIQILGEMTGGNSAPMISPVANLQSNLDDVVNFAIEATDNEGDQISYTATDLPTGLEISATSGMISGTATQSGTFNVTVTATDNGSPVLNSSVSFVWTVQNVIVNPTVLYRVNAGGSQLTGDPLNWEQDQSNAPAATYDANSPAKSTGWNVAISPNTTDAPSVLFGTYRYAPSWANNIAYHFPASNGTYLVKMYFAEKYNNSVNEGERVFDVEIEGQLAVSNLDITAAVGDGALVREFSITVTDGTLDLELLRNIGNPIINGIEIIAGGDVPPAPAPVLGERKAMKLRIFPNPATDQVNFEFAANTSDDKVSVQIFGLNGQEVLSQTHDLKSGQNQSYVSLVDLQLRPGIYLLKLGTKSHPEQYGRFIKE